MTPINLTRERVMREIEKVQDPCACASIMTLDLIKDVNIRQDGHVSVTYELTSPFCAGMFAAQIGVDIKKHVLSIPGVKSVEVTVNDHLMASEINDRIREASNGSSERIVLHDPFVSAGSS